VSPYQSPTTQKRRVGRVLRIQGNAGGASMDMGIFTPHGELEKKSVYDIIIVGSGVIGLYTAYELLNMGYRVAVIEKYDTLCAGATGAGQGYIWMCHRDPLAVGAWNMAKQSRERWNELLASYEGEYNIKDIFDRNGSLLIANNAKEKAALTSRAAALIQQGMHPVYLSSRDDVEREEPALKHAEVDITAGILLKEDGQIDGKLSMQILYDKCMLQGDRFTCVFGHAVESLCISKSLSSLEVQGIRLENGTNMEANAVVVCAGAWSGQALSLWLGEECSDVWANTIVPRRGHLLVMKPSNTSKTGVRNLKHGIMESSYTKHYSAKQARDYDITFTATENAVNNTLMIGSSRELPKEEQWSQKVNPKCRDDIVRVARSYLPELLRDARIVETRVGLRPYSLGHKDHRPFIGPVPHTNGLFVAAGHEGSGLTLAPSTADVIIHHLQDRGYIRPESDKRPIDLSLIHI